jgi:hypothetical protein
VFKVVIIDLRFREPGCGGHPVTKLNRVLKELKDSEAVILVNPEDIPVKVLEVLIDRHGFRVASVEENLGYVKVFIRKV